jgi:putative lipoprotein
VKPLWLALGALLCAGCTHEDHVAQTPSPSASVVRGTIAYRERVALPTDAEIDLWIRDVTPGIMIMSLVAETTVVTQGRQVPIPYELAFDPGRIEPTHDYAVSAAIRSGGEILFETPSPTKVITRGSPTTVSLMTKGRGGNTEGPTGLVGTAWRLEDLAGAGVIDNAQATLEFLDGGKIAGRGSCNRFFGTVEISGSSLRLGPIGSTKMACATAVMDQETKYLKALQDAERFQRDGSALLVFSKGSDRPLRFQPEGK